MNDKNMMSFLFYCLVASFCFSCSSNLEELVIKDKTTSEKIKTRGLESYSSILEADKAILAAHGYDTIAIVDCDSFYLVESELIFKKSRLQELREQPEARLNYKRRINPECYRIHLILYDNQYSNETIFKEAVAEWNKLSKCCLHFSTYFDTFLPKNRPLIDVFFQDNANSMSSSEFIRVAGVINGNVGNKIYINTKYKYWSELTKDQKKYALMHAIGHLVGLEHSSE